MPGAPDPLYVKAREVLLDALEALAPHRSSLVLVGAQAIYLHTGEADLAVAPYTTDADLVIDPARLGSRPSVGESLEASGFVPGVQPGQWLKEGIRVDLMVPEAVAGPGRRGVRLGAHGKRTARKARGLEGALVDRELHEVASLGEGSRRIEVAVAGPASLLVSKLHKLAERLDEAGRLKDKDALDVLRILRAVPTPTLAQRLKRMQKDSRAATATAEAIGQLRTLFGTRDAPGSGFAARACEALELGDTIKASCAALSQDLLAALTHR
jgi:hypothetical protein